MAAADASVLFCGGGAAPALLAARPRVRPVPDRAMGAAGGGRCVRPGAAPVLVLLLLIAAAALPRRARAVTDAGDGNVPCSARLSSHFLRLIVCNLAVGRHQLCACTGCRLVRLVGLCCLRGDDWSLLLRRVMEFGCVLTREIDGFGFGAVVLLHWGLGVGGC